MQDAQGEERTKIKYLIQRMENQLRSQRDLEEKEKKVALIFKTKFLTYITLIDLLFLAFLEEDCQINVG